MQRHSHVLRILLAGAAFAPAALVACTVETTRTGTDSPQPTATGTTTSPSGTSTSPAPTSTSSSSDGGTDAAKDSGPPPTDVAGSAECDAYCAKMKSECGRTCDPKLDCEIDKGQCTESTKDYLDCVTQTGSWSCGEDGFSIVSSCKRDTSLCN